MAGEGVTLADSTDHGAVIGDNSSSLESFSNASAEVTVRLSEMSKYLSEQEQILKNTRKQWKLLTGGIIGAFYSIAKLSPLFASYISEFGGVLGYVYDTAIIPWSDSIEGLLDIMWGSADAFDDSSDGIQKWTGLLLMGVPIAAGILVSLAGLGEILLMIASGTIVKGILGVITGLAGWPAVIALIVVAFAIWFAKITGLDKVLVEVLKRAYDKLISWKDSIIIIFGLLKEIAGKLLDKLVPNFKEKLDNAFGLLKHWVLTIVRYLDEKWPKWLRPGAMTSAALSGTESILTSISESAWLNSHATGATITQDGLYKLHQGERVTASTLTNNNAKSTNVITISPQITISGGVSSSIDARKLASDLSKYWLVDIQKAVGSSYK